MPSKKTNNPLSLVEDPLQARMGEVCQPGDRKFEGFETIIISSSKYSFVDSV
jgi:hypothetical protein